MKKWIPNSGVNALDLIGSKITASDKVRAEQLIQMNYGVEYPSEKFQMLYEMIENDNWSSERFQHTLKWFLKTKKFPNWTIADFFEHKSPKLYPYSRYLSELEKNRSLNDEIEWCTVEELRLWYYKIDNLNINT